MRIRSIFVAPVAAAAFVATFASAGLESRTAQPLRPEQRAPLPFFDLCRCSGTLFQRAPGGGVSLSSYALNVTDVDDPATMPRDTCPAGSLLEIAWHAEPSGVTGWAYRLNEPDFIEVPPPVRSVTYDGIPPSSLPGNISVFTLRAYGPRGTHRDSTRRFVRGFFPPETWWAGPELASPSFQIKPNGERYVLIGTSIAGSLLSPDSVQILPALRPERRTFLEIWNDTVYARVEGDTVHLNSWVVLHSGGFDADSPYSVKVTELATQLPDFPGGPVLEPGPANGSPIGFRTALQMILPPSNLFFNPAVSNFYPVFDPNDVFHQPQIAYYFPSLLTGRYFAVTRAMDGDDLRDDRVADGRALVLKVEAGTATPAEQALRPLVLTYHVNRPPHFVTEDAAFRPQHLQTFTTAEWNLNLVAGDVDPMEPGGPRGGPTGPVVLRRKVKVIGQDLQGAPLVHTVPNVYVNQQSIVVAVPPALAPGPCMIEVELCDCQFCEDRPGSGRCVTQRFPVYYAPTGTAGQAASSADKEPATERTALLAPYPNPAQAGATIAFTLASAGPVELELFNVAGRRVRLLLHQSLPAGAHTLAWNGKDDDGRSMAAGIYFVRLRAEGATMKRKLFMAH